MQQNILVIAIRKFKGEVSGTTHDFTKITYIACGENNLNTDTEKGNYPIEVAYGTSKEYDSLAKISYPAIFNADFDIVQGRKKIQINLKELEFVSSLTI